MIYRITVINGRKYATAVKSREEFLALRDSSENLASLAKARQGDDAAKKNLVQFAYNLGHVDGLIAGCKSVGSFFFHDIDCYDMSQSESICQQILSKKDEIGLMMLERSASGGWHLVCKRVPGTTILENQVRVACALKVGDMDNNARDLQRVVFGTSGSAEDLIYLDNELFLEPMSAEECEAEYVRLKERECKGEERLPPGAKKANKHYKPWEEDDLATDYRTDRTALSSRPSEARGEISQMRPGAQAASRRDPSTTLGMTMEGGALGMTSGGGTLGMTSGDGTLGMTGGGGALGMTKGGTLGMTGGGDFPDNYHGIPFTTILKKYWELNNGGFEPNVGDRDTLTFQLASDLRHICGRNAEWLDQVIPCYDGFPIEEKRQKIANALKSSYEGMPGRLKTVLDALEGRMPALSSRPSTSSPSLSSRPSEARGEISWISERDVSTPLDMTNGEGALDMTGGEGTLGMTNGEGEPSSDLSRLFASNRPPEIPNKRPKLVDAILCNTPQKYKATVAQAMFPGLMAYPKNLSFLYIDNQVRELRANCLIVAGTGSGKDSCTKQPLAHLIADMKARDEENRRRLKEFNDEYNSKAANKQKPQRPADLIIQTIKSDITKAALVQRMDEAQGAPLYVRINELEQWDKIEGASGRGNQFTTLKLCDDEGNDYGTDRAGTQSVTGSGSLHLNWNANTTTAKAIKYFRYVLTDGPISRLCLATIPEEEVGAEISVFGTYGEQYDAALKPYIENLKAATGVIDCKEAKKLARKLKNECADFARLSQDRVFDNLSHRALVIAFRKACMLYAANGMKWEKSIETFCRWSLYYDLYIKMTIFGDLIRHADDDIPTSKRGPQSLLALLPAEFTVEDARRVRLQQGMDAEHTLTMIRNWKSRHFVNQISDISFRKSGKGKSNLKM